MTPEEQQQVNAMMRFYEARLIESVRDGANAAFMAEALAIKLKAAEGKEKEVKEAA